MNKSLNYSKPFQFRQFGRKCQTKEKLIGPLLSIKLAGLSYFSIFLKKMPTLRLKSFLIAIFFCSAFASVDLMGQCTGPISCENIPGAQDKLYCFEFDTEAQAIAFRALLPTSIDYSNDNTAVLVAVGDPLDPDASPTRVCYYDILGNCSLKADLEDLIFSGACDDMNDCTTDEFNRNTCECDNTGPSEGDPCTGPDPCKTYTIDANCDCIGVGPSEGDPCTGPDPCKTYTIDANCDCTGVGPTKGDPCTGPDPCKTYTIDANCNCVSSPGPTFGQPCNDGLACTINDKYDEHCNCRGEGIGIPGDSCDDGDDCTINDTLDEDCQCKGEPGPDSDKDGTLDCMDTCPYDIDGMVYADLKCGVLVNGNNFSGKSKLTDYGACSEKCLAPGRELVYRFNQTSQSDIVITFKEAGHPQLKRLNLFVITDPCTPKGCMPENAINAPLMGNQDPERVVIKDAAPGDYYIIIDGHKPYATNDFTLLLECTGGSAASCPENAHYFESFESYRVGKRITTQDSHHWETVGNSSGSALISKDRASNYEQSLEFNRYEGGAQDINLDLGRKYSGAYRISWDMYINPMSTAHFGLFGGDNSDPWGTVGHTFRMNATKYQGKWFKVELFVDMDKNKYALFMDNRHFQETGKYYLNLHHLNLYSPPGGHFYVDNICYAAVEAIPSVSSSSETASDRQQDSRFTEDITLFPNPATDEVMLDLRKYTGKEVDLVIYNAMSFEVYRKHIPKVGKELERVSLDNFTNGLYLVNVKGKGMRTKTKKLIVSKLY